MWVVRVVWKGMRTVGVLAMLDVMRWRELFVEL